MSYAPVLDRPATSDVVELRPEAGAIEALAEQYYDLLALNPEDLHAALARRARAEDTLPDRERAAAAHRRLSAWLALGDEDARILANAYDEALRALPASLAGRRMEAERDAVLNGMRFADFRRLAGILPWLRAEEGLDLLFPGGSPWAPRSAA
jgi:hypothetical protein